MRSQIGSIKAWLIFIFVVILAFAALYYFRSIEKVPTEQPEEITGEVKPSKEFALEEMTEAEKKQMDDEALSGAITSGSIEDCEKILDEKLRNQCLDTLGYAAILASGDEKQCEKLNNESLRKQCLDKIYYSEAMDTMDSDLCQKISDQALKQQCIDQIQSVLGRNAESEADCESISDPVLKQECLDNFYYSSSIKELDEGSCSNITNSDLRERCSKTIAQNIKVIEIAEKQQAEKPKSTEEVLEACDNLSGEQAQNCKDKANYDLAFEKKDLSYCNYIADAESKQECLDTQSDSINQFYLRQATATGNSALCDKITNASLKTLCNDSL